MKYNLDWLYQQQESGNRIKYLFFWGHELKGSDVITSACFSQWFERSFKVDGIVYKTAEHWMMAQKALLFDDQPIFEKIILCNKPGEAKELGRNVASFNEDVWVNKRTDIVKEGNIHKFNQHPDLKAFLLNTKQRVLVEASPVDIIWGVGLGKDNPKINNPAEWKGLNLLGFTLMEVRDILNG